MGTRELLLRAAGTRRDALTPVHVWLDICALQPAALWARLPGKTSYHGDGTRSRAAEGHVTRHCRAM